MPDDPTPADPPAGAPGDDADRIIRFPQSRVPGRGKNHPVRELGFTRLVQQLDPSGRKATGHWCGRCQGVWYGYLTETECPVCGNRNG